MEEHHDHGKNTKVFFSNRTNETKYYLLTEGSGYPLAEFSFPNLSTYRGSGMVVPENRPKTAILFQAPMRPSSLRKVD
ncbi:MAG: hypothetical protein K6U74_17105 [Firmicutes bacterium]|nr:hypothetical protein [Bacillota bacterium]